MFFTLLFAACLVAGALMRPAIWRTGRWVAPTNLVLCFAVALWTGDALVGLYAPLGIVMTFVAAGILFNGSGSAPMALLALASVLLNPLGIADFCLLSIRVGAWLRGVHDNSSPSLALALAALVLAVDVASGVYLIQRGRAAVAAREARDT
ncbi:hypothetical protein [Tropicimonas aquimaris]|uniref:Uncharacterized protein n=1 Tax=Tropicimonas aquimaris TaxID=914152 RepID=A0ABW3IW98_9RHOB